MAYYSRISYDQIRLDIITTNEWIVIGNSAEYPDRGQTWYDRAKIEAKNKNNLYDSSKYDIVLVVDPADHGSAEVVDSNGQKKKITYNGRVDGNNAVIMVFTPHNIFYSDPYTAMVKLTGHEITHAIDYLDDGKGVIPQTPVRRRLWRDLA